MLSFAKKLEFDAVLERIADYCRTEVGKRLILESTLFADPISLDEHLAKLREMDDLLLRYDRLPIEVSSDLEKPLDLARKGGTLMPVDLERVANDIFTLEAVKRFLSKTEGLPLLTAYASALPSLPYLEKTIHKVIAPDMSIYDGASPKLRGIRAAKRKLEERMKKRLGEIVSLNRDFLSDETLSMKNGHYVLPVSNAYKRKVKGIVQDVSGSGETTFIEPEVIVELNNEMMELENEERTEVLRLLKELSSSVGAHQEELSSVNKGLGFLDALEAKIHYKETTKGTIPTRVKEASIEFLEARHPLLDPKTVVPNDFHLEEKSRMVILSGPNAGGKTVALKTLGLLLLMAESGFPIPARDGATFSYFPYLYLDIGDNQSLSDNLSTFSAHMKALSEILLSVDGKSLVLLDELGTGTSPKEGEALAIAILHYLLKKHCFVMVSSHFEALKAFALSEEGVTNASMLFDKERLLPTYKMQMGLPGESYGLALAERYHLPEEVLGEAKKRLDEAEDLSVSDAIKKLSDATKENLDLKEELLKEKAALAAKESALESREKALALKETRFNDALNLEKKKLLSEYEEKLQEIYKSALDGEGKLHTVIKAKKSLHDLEDDGPSPETFFGPLQEGDYVRIPSLFVEGKLTELKGEKATVTTPEGLVIHSKRSLLERIQKPERKKAETKVTGLSLDNVASRKSVPLECNLIGLHYEEAKLALEKYLDDALLRRYSRVRIIHGWGSGVLRKMVWDYAKAHPEIVSSIEGASGEEGGGGASILYLGKKR